MRSFGSRDATWGTQDCVLQALKAVKNGRREGALTMNTNATNLNLPDTLRSAADAIAQAVFVFDPATGDAVSMNSGAAALIQRFSLDKAPRLSLATIERGVMAEGKIKIEPTVTDGLIGEASELRRVCRHNDGSVLALSRVWAPGSSTMLVVEDLTAAEQERRRRRIWDMLVSNLARSENVSTVLAKALRIFCLLSRSPSGEVWLTEGEALTRRSVRVSPQTVSEMTSSTARLKSADDSLVGRVWSSEKPIYEESRVAMPIHAGDKLVAVLVLGASPSCPSDYMVFSLIESLAPLFGLALFIFRQSEAMQTLRARLGDGVQIESSRSASASSRAKPMGVVAGMRAAG